MAKAETWFPSFAVRLMDLVRRTDWPAPGSGFWEALRSRVVHHGVREDEADAALGLLVDAPPAHLDRVWPELLAAVRTLRESRSRSPAPAHGTFDEARAASKNCPHCGGEGRATAFHPTVAYQPFAAVCLCAAGRYFAAALDPETARRVVRLETWVDEWGGESVRAVSPGGLEYPLEPPPLAELEDPSGTPLPEVWARRAPGPRPRAAPAAPDSAGKA